MSNHHAPAAGDTGADPPTVTPARFVISPCHANDNSSNAVSMSSGVMYESTPSPDSGCICALAFAKLISGSPFL